MKNHVRTLISYYLIMLLLSDHLNDENTLPIEQSESEIVHAPPPAGVTDFDQETAHDPFQVGVYAQEIFAYYRRRESRFVIRKYLENQPQFNPLMRAILVDWMVEVQVRCSFCFVSTVECH